MVLFWWKNAGHPTFNGVGFNYISTGSVGRRIMSEGLGGLQPKKKRPLNGVRHSGRLMHEGLSNLATPMPWRTICTSTPIGFRKPANVSPALAFSGGRRADHLSDIPELRARTSRASAHCELSPNCNVPINRCRQGPGGRDREHSGPTNLGQKQPKSV